MVLSVNCELDTAHKVSAKDTRKLKVLGPSQTIDMKRTCHSTGMAIFVSPENC